MEKVAAFYKFATVSDPVGLRAVIENFAEPRGILGTILVASEGLNGTISGGPEAVDALIEFLCEQEGFAELEVKYSQATEAAFYRLKVKVKKEIVTLGRPDINPNDAVGNYVEPDEWDQLIQDPEVLVIDTRNDFEVRMGSFPGALNPQTETFREFPSWVDANLDKDKPPKKIAMFCTGGIRCEKATSLIKQLGFDEVYHLKGGILRYLETIPRDQSSWTGECFVFDNRVGIKSGLKQGSYELCYACHEPISPEDQKSPEYERGISCPACASKSSPEKRRAAEERQKQIELAKARGRPHFGPHSQRSS